MMITLPKLPLPPLPRQRFLLIGVGIVVLLTVPLLIVNLRKPASPQPFQTIPGTFPVPPGDPSVKSAYVTYIFTVVVQEVTTTPQGTYLFLNQQGAPLPPLPITFPTKIVVKRGDQTLNAVVQNIKNGDLVTVHSLYNAQKETWSVSLIEVIKQ